LPKISLFFTIDKRIFLTYVQKLIFIFRIHTMFLLINLIQQEAITMRWKQLLGTSLILLSVTSTSLQVQASQEMQNNSVVGQGSVERIVWTQTPIPLQLRVNSERMVKFSSPVRVKPPEELDPTKLRIQSVGGTVYLKALEPFKAARMLVQKFNASTQTFEGGQMYLIDLRAQTEGSNEIVQIIDQTSPQNKTVNSNNQMTTASQQSQVQPIPMLKTVDMVTLVRHAVQQMYAPQRLLKKRQGIHQSRLRKIGKISLYRGGEVSTVPLATWKSGSLYVTAVRVTNEMNIPVELDPRLFRGQWRSRTLQHGRVGQKGLETDTTTVYLVSDRPFHESMI
jgi:integrating conjugative element protein (TIGR03749 family)